MNVVDYKWVFIFKLNPDGNIQCYKARLVAKGFQQTVRVDFNETFSLDASYGWDIQQIDINNAFLNGVLQETFFMSQLECFLSSQHPTHVCKLNKDLYGLKQAPRACFDKLKATLLQWGFQNLKFDSSLFIY